MTVRASASVLGPAAWWTSRHRSSQAVKAWSRSSLQSSRYGALHARVGGDGGRAILLLHGLVSTGAIFGGAYDQLSLTNRLVVPDLLGFGDSLDETRSSFALVDHLDALDELAARSGMFSYGRWTIGAHSMGSAVALAWAARHQDRVDRVACWGAPMYASPAAAQAQISGTMMTRLFVLDTKWAERACAVNCRHRIAAGWLTAAVEPRLPVPVARAVSLHTWPAYRDAMRDLVIETDWATLIRDLDDSAIDVRLIWGEHDVVGDRAFADSTASSLRHVTIGAVTDADHRLPMTNPALCLEHLVSRSRKQEAGA